MTQTYDLERIIIEIEGGMVTDVTGIPAGVIVEVRDFDAADGDADPDSTTEIDGRLAWVSEYEG